MLAQGWLNGFHTIHCSFFGTVRATASRVLGELRGQGVSPCKCHLLLFPNGIAISALVTFAEVESDIIIYAGYSAHMKRVTKRVRNVKTVTAMRHLVFTSEQHERDRKAADRLRSVEFVAVPLRAGEKPRSFPEAAEFSGVGLFEKGRLMQTTPEEFEIALVAARADAGRYWVKSKKQKRNGEPALQKRNVDGLRDCYFSFPPWVTEYLARMLEKGKFRKARIVASNVMEKVGEALGKRTGYIPVGAALHPDNRLALGFHIQFKVVSGEKLLGRSANGTKGRKGLRLLGDSNLALSRFAEFIPVDAKMKKKFESKDWDDLALDQVMKAALKENLADDWDAIERAGKAYAENWKQRRDDALRETDKAKRLQAELNRLQDETDFLKAQNKSLLEDRGKLVEDFEAELKLVQDEADSLKMQNKVLTEENAKQAAQLEKLGKDLDEFQKNM